MVIPVQLENPHSFKDVHLLHGRSKSLTQLSKMDVHSSVDKVCPLDVNTVKLIVQSKLLAEITTAL